MNDQPDARRFLENPTTAGDRRKRLLKEIFDALSADRRVANFVGILVDRTRLPELEDIIEAYQKLLDDRLGIVRARVTSSHSLNASEQRELSGLAKRWGLLVTGGSDNHGDREGRDTMRSQRVPRAWADAVLARSAARRGGRA